MSAPETADITMPDTEVYLEKLALFSSILRNEGMEAGLGETEDAVRVLEATGLEDRQTVKTALRTIFAKSREEQLRFDRIFDSFFLSEDAIRALDSKRTAQEQEKRKAMEKAEQDLKDLSESVIYTDAQKEAYSQLPEEEKQHMRELKEKFTGEGSRNRELYTTLIHSVFAKSILEQQLRMEDAALGGQTVDPEMGLLFKDIAGISDVEIPKAVMYIQDLASQINCELVRRQKASNHGSRLNFRKTIRKGLETGGNFYRLSYRQKKQKKRQLIIMCDVSASMIQFSEFVLRFIQALDKATANSRVILFSEDSCEADRFHLQNMDLFREYVRRCGLYGRGTDLGKALKKLNDERPPVLSASVILLLISDAKSVNPSLVCDELRRAGSRAGKVMCLNPVAKNKWKYSAGLTAAANCCTMLPCSNLDELGKACRKLALM